jgi:ParB/RepB/Spo0J family partition protein
MTETATASDRRGDSILLSPSQIAESKTNPRTHFDKRALDELTESVRKHGVLQPILVRPLPGADEMTVQFELVCGHRRLRAAQAAELREILVHVRDLSDVEVLEVQLIENLERRDLHPLEEAAGYRALMSKAHGYTAAKIAERTGRSSKYVYDRVKLLELTKGAQKLFLEDRITAGHAILLARLSPKDQERCIGEEKRHKFRGLEFSGGLLEHDHALFDADDETAFKYKARSVRELQAWIDKNVRFNRADVDPMLFPETAAAIETVQGASAKPKIIPITEDYHIDPCAKTDERTFGPISWRRADGKKGSKACEHKILGVIVVGHGRGEAFDVCIAKDKCKVHWAKEQREKAKRTATGGANAKSAPAKKPEWQLRQEREEKLRVEYRGVKTAVCDAIAAHVKGMSVADVAAAIMDRFNDLLSKPALVLVPEGEDPDDLLRCLLFGSLYIDLDDDWGGPAALRVIAKTLDLDAKKILNDASAPPAKVRTCKKCGCTEADCSRCVEKTGEPCSWVAKDLCSACVPAKAAKPAKKRKTA